jgi:hypothetical protein
MLPLGELEERLGPLLAETARKIETQLAFDEAAVTIVE